MKPLYGNLDDAQYIKELEARCCRAVEKIKRLTAESARLLKDLKLIHAMADSDKPEPDIVDFVRNQSFMAIHDAASGSQGQ